MYIVQQPYKCIKCGFEFLFGPHDKHNAPKVGVDDDPVCPHCWEVFLRANLGIGYCTIAWDPSGSEYENRMKKE